MSDPLGMAAQLASNALKFGWYTGVGWLARREANRAGGVPSYSPERPAPSRAELSEDLRRLLVADAEGVRTGALPPPEIGAVAPGDRIARLRAMMSDIPGTVSRRSERDAGTAADLADDDRLPGYFKQDFHFQTGGYLSEESAKIYDVQVETLFNGTAQAMRRSGLRAIADFMRGKDQRAVALLDVACGTGRLLRDIRLAYPAMWLTGLDLSKSYLREADAHLAGLRPVEWIAANAETIPLAAASQDIVTSVFLFHELPPEARARAAAEMARVLKPGGLLVFTDSLQFGDKPGWDGLLEGFPVRFHEPYYRGYLIEDLDKLFAGVGLVREADWTAFMSKVMVRRKP